MAYLTIQQTTTLLNNEGRGVRFSDLDNNRQIELINLASERIEAIPFNNSELPTPRYTDGFVSGTDIEMPHVLKRATATLSLWYMDNTFVDYTTFQTRNIDTGLSPFMADLPIAIQTALWSFVSQDVQLGGGRRITPAGGAKLK